MVKPQNVSYYSAWVYLPRLPNTHSSDPYPFAVDEVFDAYRVIVESKGKAIGIGVEDINIALSGDSACV
jgi:acetyl esterase/lipase